MCFHSVAQLLKHFFSRAMVMGSIPGKHILMKNAGLKCSLIKMSSKSIQLNFFGKLFLPSITFEGIFFLSLVAVRNNIGLERYDTAT